MKTTFALLIALILGGVLAPLSANAEYRNVKVNTSSAYQVEYSLGQITFALNPKPIGDWTPLPYAIGKKDIPTIIGSKDFGQILPLTTTQPFMVSSDQCAIGFDLEASASDPSISGKADASASSASVELVDAASGSVLATMYSFSSFQDVTWTGTKHTSMQYYAVPTNLAGHSVYVCMNVAWNGTAGSGSYDFNATTAAQTLAYGATSLGKKSNNSNLLAEDIHLSNSPNPVVDVTNIQIQSSSAPVSLKVYDVAGREVANLSSALTSAQNMQVMFNASNLRSGIYFYRLVTETGVQQRQMNVTR